MVRAYQQTKCVCEQMQEAEDKKKRTRREELEHIQLRKAADEVFRRNEAEKEQQRFEENQNVTSFLFAQMVREILAAIFGSMFLWILISVVRTWLPFSVSLLVWILV